MKEFKDKVIVITGGASGLGLNIAKEAVKRGMKIVINDLRNNPLKKAVMEIKDMGGEVVSYHADISIYENVKELLDITISEYGQVDILINNAGIGSAGAIWEIPVQDMLWATEVNFLSHLYGSQVFIPKMIEQGTDGVIVNVASAAGLVTTPNANMYHATKHADVAQSEATAMALKSKGINNIQMHVLCPMFVQTSIHKSDPNYRLDRYSEDDPYYETEDYRAALRRGESAVVNGIPVDSVGLTVFQAIEDNNFYILTHPEIALLAGQRVQKILNGKNPF